MNERFYWYKNQLVHKGKKKHLHVSKQLDYIKYTQRDRSRDETFKGDVPLHPRYNAVMGTAARAML